jgi:GNAT superfamily N-acetyltransferase
MRRYLYEMSQLPLAERVKVAAYVSAFTESPDGQAAELLPLRPDEILARRLGIVACVNNTFVGYAGRRDEPTDFERRVEIGPFVVHPGHRLQGHGRALLTRLSHEVVSQGQIPFVLGNQANMQNLRTAGFLPVTWEDLPPNTYRPDQPDNNVPVMLLQEPLQTDIPFDIMPADFILQIPQHL